MPAIVSVKFDQNDNGVFFSGEVVSGKVEISCSKAKLVQNIAIQILGYAKTYWDNTYLKMNSIKRNRLIYYDHSGREEYVSTNTYLIGSEDATPKELLPGMHTYNFSCDLPQVLPCSFEGNHGYIRYLAKVIIKRPYKNDQIFIEGFTVLNRLDLNQDTPVLKLRAEVETVHEFWCLMCISKPLHMKVSVPQTGFVSGQIIPIRTEINNSCNIDILEVRYYLRKIVSYNSDMFTAHNKKEVVQLVTMTSGHIIRKGRNKFEEYLAVPKTSTTTNRLHSKIIQIDYDIKVEAVIAGWHRNPHLICPITIGTVLLKDIVQNELQSQDEEIASEITTKNENEDGVEEVLISSRDE